MKLEVLYRVVTYVIFSSFYHHFNYSITSFLINKHVSLLLLLNESKTNIRILFQEINELRTNKKKEKKKKKKKKVRKIVS